MAKKAAQKKKVNLLANTTAEERKRAETRIAANKKKAVAKVKEKPKGNARTKKIDKIVKKATKG